MDVTEIQLVYADNTSYTYTLENNECYNIIFESYLKRIFLVKDYSKFPSSFKYHYTELFEALKKIETTAVVNLIVNDYIINQYEISSSSYKCYRISNNIGSQKSCIEQLELEL